MRLPSRRGAAIALGAAALAVSLSSCGSSSAPAGTLPKVSGPFGSLATITFPNGSPSSTLQVKVLKEGTGPVVHKGDLLVANYVGQIWQGKVFDSSFSRHQLSAFPIGVHRVILGWDDALVGVHWGTRLLMVVPPAYGYGARGQPQAGIKPSDTLVFVVDVVASFPRSAVGPGAAAAVHAGVNGITVAWPSAMPPVLHVPSGLAIPGKSTITIVSRGTGPPVTPGLLVLQYVVVDAKTGKVVQSTWKNGIPDSGIVGDPAQPSVLDKFLGLPVGTRAILRVPKLPTGGPYVFAVEVVAEPSASG